MSKRSEKLDRDAEYIKTLKVSRLPGYLTVQMVRFQFKQKDAINAKILKDIKFPMMLDTFDLCSQDLQNKLVPMRAQFKAYEDSIVETVLLYDFILGTLFVNITYPLPIFRPLKLPRSKEVVSKLSKMPKRLMRTRRWFNIGSKMTSVQTTLDITNCKLF